MSCVSVMWLNLVSRRGSTFSFTRRATHKKSISHRRQRMRSLTMTKSENFVWILLKENLTEKSFSGAIKLYCPKEIIFGFDLDANEWKQRVTWRHS